MQESEILRNRRSTQPCGLDEIRPRGVGGWVDYYQKNKPQTNALAAGIMVVLYGGQQMAWGIFNNHLKAQPWAGGYEDEGTVFWAITSWFIAVIVGLFAASIAVNKWSKLSIYFFTSVLSAISAALLVSYPDNIYYLFPSRIIGGLSHGIVYPTVIIHACEVAVPKLRGMIVGSIHFCLVIGFFTTSSCLLPVFEARSYDVDPTRTIGINGLICIGSGLLIAVFFNRESPVYLIRKYRDNEAIDIMIRLRSESHETADIRRDFSEFKTMVLEDGKSSLNIFDRKNRWPLFTVLLLKVIFVASFNMPLNIIWLDAVAAKLYNGSTDPSGMCLSGARWGVMLVTMFVIDCKRIKLLMMSTGVCSIILLTLVYTLQHQTTGEATAIAILAFAFQIFSGMAIGMLMDVYATEAFNTKKKPLSIAFTSSIEFLLQILLIVVHFYLKVSLPLLVGLLGLVMATGLGAFILPDTSRMSLRNARNKFDS